MNDEDIYKLQLAVHIMQHKFVLQSAIQAIDMHCVKLQQYADNDLEFQALSFLVLARTNLQEVLENLTDLTEEKK